MALALYGYVTIKLLGLKVLSSNVSQHLSNNQSLFISGTSDGDVTRLTKTITVNVRSLSSNQEETDTKYYMLHIEPI